MTTINIDEVGILIAVRMKSSRLTNKALVNIVGKTVISHLIERMKRAKMVGNIILCTSTHPDDKVLLDIADEEGILKFAGSELDVMDRFIKASEEYGIKTIVRVTGDNPLTDPENIDRMIEIHYKGKYDFTKSEYFPLGVNAEVISLYTLKKAHQLAMDTNLTEYMTSYLKRPDIFKIHTTKNYDEFFNGRALIRLTVDFDKDLHVMNKIYGHLYNDNPNFTIREVLEYLDSNPEVLDINNNMLEIPLPKIKFKGEKVYDKKLIICGREINDFVLIIIDKIKKLDEYDIIGFLHYESNQQYSLIDGIPTLGDCRDIDKIDINGDYFCTVFEEKELNEEFSRKLIERGMKKLEL